MKERIKIYLIRGDYDEWFGKDWDDYKIEGNLFIVLREGDYVGVYPLSSIYKLIVK